MSEPARLHVLAQRYPHDDVRIVGSVDGLTLLKVAIEDALSGHGPARSIRDLFGVDGEAFSVVVRLNKNNEADWLKLKLPYTATEYGEPEV